MKLWTPNQHLQDGRFIIEKILGGGGFGVTYSAREQPSGRLVAIKTLNHIQQSKPDFRQQQQKFVNEALRLARCSHPHIVQVYEMIEEDGLWGMVMEYIHGEDLGVYIEERGVLDESEALRIIGQIGSALTFIHKQNFLHRDVKPQNIILRQDTLAGVLIDFGLAREFISGQVQSMTNQLTQCFAPIEQYSRRGTPGDYTDVYALAATLYNLLTGSLPIPANFRQHNISLVEPKQHNSNISDRVNSAIINGMALEPQNRPQSVQEWLELLMPSPRQPPASDDVKLISYPPLYSFEFDVAEIIQKSGLFTRGLETNRQRRKAQYFAEDLGNQIILEMVSIPGGTFMMGSPDTEEGRYDTESPQHRVTVAPFFMGKYSITQAQWKAVAALPRINTSLNPDPSRFKGANRPVENISWFDAVEFCERLSVKTGRDHRLPSEAQWEYACRAGTTTPFHNGETITPSLANYDGNYTYGAGSKGEYRKETTVVGSFQIANAFGLYDMHGNIWEWCYDTWHENYQGAPSDGSAWESGGDDTCRMFRGGSWDNYPRRCRSAYRYRHGADVRFQYCGFRVAVSS